MSFKQMLKDELSVKGVATLCLEAVGIIGLMIAAIVITLVIFAFRP